MVYTVYWLFGMKADAQYCELCEFERKRDRSDGETRKPFTSSFTGTALDFPHPFISLPLPPSYSLSLAFQLHWSIKPTAKQTREKGFVIFWQVKREGGSEGEIQTHTHTHTEGWVGNERSGLFKFSIKRISCCSPTETGRDGKKEKQWKKDIRV